MSNVPMTRPEQALSIQKHDWGHSPSFVELDDGRIYLSVGRPYRPPIQTRTNTTQPERGGIPGGSSAPPMATRRPVPSS